MNTFTTPLIAPHRLMALLDDPKLIVLDASISPIGNMVKPQYGWPETSIPGAQFFDIENDFSDMDNPLPHTLPSVEQFETEVRKLGVCNESKVVVYDNHGMFSSARAWYMLKAMGFSQVSVLNGGLPAWLAQELPVCSTNGRNIEKGNFTARYLPSFFCDADQVAAFIEQDKVSIVDARAAVRFLGQVEEPRAGIRSGHIPTSLNLPYGDLLANGQLLEAADLVAQFNALELTQEHKWVMSCGSGITACILALAAYVVGHENVCVYDGSWSDWGKDFSRPIA